MGWRVLGLVALFAVGGVLYWRWSIPMHRVAVRSELVMLGDADGDHRWTEADAAAFETMVATPFQSPAELVWKFDLNQNRRIDPEDRRLLQGLVAARGDPYGAEESAWARGESFPRPREFYRYLPIEAYRPRPVWAMPYRWDPNSPLAGLGGASEAALPGGYDEELEAAIRDEAVRFDQAWQRRVGGLLPRERDYATERLTRVADLHRKGERYELLLALIELVEDAETLSLRDQPAMALGLLAFRDHLREVLVSELFRGFGAGTRGASEVLAEVSRHLRSDLGVQANLETLGPPRDLSHLENYLQRAEWQYYKSSAREEDFRALIAFAQHDPRYLRAVARTNRKHQDPELANHNLPMVLLFREAVRLTGGDKKKAAGLLDESIRIPFAWVKSIPRERLPSSLAFDNFLLPGNKEDGGDKSRHWNVFGALCLYKSPGEALDLALRRELMDWRKGRGGEVEMREFLRDMIGNLNGMFHVMVMNPSLHSSLPSPRTP